MPKKMKFGEINASEIKNIAITIVVIVIAYNVLKIVLNFFKDPMGDIAGLASTLSNYMDTWLGTCGTCNVLKTDPKTGITSAVPPSKSDGPCRKWLRLSCVADLEIWLKALIVPFIAIISGIWKVFGLYQSRLAKRWVSITGKSYDDILRELRVEIKEILSKSDIMENLKDMTARDLAIKDGVTTKEDWENYTDKEKYLQKIKSKDLINQVTVSSVDAFNKKIANGLDQGQKDQLVKEASNTFINAKIAYNDSESSKNEKSTEDAIDRVKEATDKAKPE